MVVRPALSQSYVVRVGTGLCVDALEPSQEEQGGDGGDGGSIRMVEMVLYQPISVTLDLKNEERTRGRYLCVLASS